MSTELALVPVAGCPLLSVFHDGQVYVPMKQLCGALSLDWRGQLERIQRSEIMAPGVRVIRIPSASPVRVTRIDEVEDVRVTRIEEPPSVRVTRTEGVSRDAVCLSVKLAYVFIVTLPLARITDPTTRENVKALQTESFDAMYDYWTVGAAHNPRFARRRAVSHRDMLAVLDRLKKAHDPAERRLLYEMLEQQNAQFSLPLPALDQIGRATPPPSRLIEEFFGGLDALTELGIGWDHARGTEVSACRPADVVAAFREHGIDAPSLSDLQPATREANSGVAKKTINSALLDRPVHCWVFAARPTQIANR